MNASDAPKETAQTAHLSLGMLGLILILVSIGAFFFSLAVAYFFAIRARPSAAAEHLSVWFWVSTAMMAASSLLLQAGRSQLRMLRLERYRTYLRYTLAAGLFFLLAQLLGCQELARQGVYVTGNPRGSMYYMFTGVHAAHLLGGIGALIWLYRKARALTDGPEQPLRRHRASARLVSIYWHFMGVLWFGLFSLLLAWGQG
jgi:cytochrome c oxidase subunit 3